MILRAIKHGNDCGQKSYCAHYWNKHSILLYFEGVDIMQWICNQNDFNSV